MASRNFIAQHASALGIDPSELRPVANTTAIPIKYDSKTGKYEFSLVRYEQHKNDIPVQGGQVGILVRNEPGNPVVLVSSGGKRLAGFVPTLRGAAVTFAAAQGSAQKALERANFKEAANKAARTTFTTFSTPESVIWAGTEERPAPPRLAVAYVAEFPGDALRQPQKVRFVADAETGDILNMESLIVFEDVVGSVRGRATAGAKASQCADDHTVDLPYAQVGASSGSSVFANASGAFTFASTDNSPITLESKLAGQYFFVSDVLQSRNSTVTSQVTPPASLDFLHNPSSSDEFVRAQVNGYVQSNQVRDWLLKIHPAYPVISGQTNFPVNVNLTSFFCPGNAWYDGGSINFCASGSGFGNTSFASVNHHEFGHHIVSSGGSGQGAYGEGMSDVIAMLIADDPGLGYGFFADQCGTPLRNADNNCQYLESGCSTCGSEVHDCGNLISGAVWSIRKELQTTNPEDHLSILANLAVNSVLLHKGTSIDGKIAIDFLTLDDNDGDIGNGTPHRAQICAGFEAHGIECPPLLVGLEVGSSGLFEPVGDPGGPFTPESTTYTVKNYGPDAIDYAVSANVPWITIAPTSGSLAAGETANVTVSINAQANTLGMGKHEAQLKFENTTTHTGDTSETITLGVGTPRVQYSWNMDENPGWTAEGDWQHGKPQGLANDPSSGATGTNVYGYNLAGAFPPNLPETHLTTQAINIANLSQLKLRFRRWLCIETHTFDHAYVRVSTDGTTWQNIWQNPSSDMIDTSWQLQEFDLSTIADGKSTLYVRWTMGKTDFVVQDCGWNIDDVEIWGLETAPQSCTTDADCSDASFCNGAEACVNGGCVAGTQVNCNDGVSCTSDSCDESSQACKHTPNHSACDNGAFCDGAETCTATGCVQSTPPCSGSCDETTDKCVACTKNADCDDGLFCTGVETCSANMCVKGPAPCADGLCNETSDACICVPQCSGKECGSDGCGGSCGTCGSGESCSSSGQCVSACTGIAEWDQSKWATYTLGTKVTRLGSLYECKDRNWSWIPPENRDGALGWIKIGPC